MSSSLHSPRYQVFRQLLVDARESAGMTQVQIAGILQKPQSFVSKFETGERRLDFTEFMEIAEALGVDIDDFIQSYRSLTKVSKRR
jgi:transcriptional regulator with XRE-family HTH domain